MEMGVHRAIKYIKLQLMEHRWHSTAYSLTIHHGQGQEWVDVYRHGMKDNLTFVRLQENAGQRQEHNL